MTKTPSKSKILARLVAEQVRNSEIENLHAGTSPSSKTGDYSDVKVVSPYGEIPWNEVSRFSDPEMRTLMLDIERNIEALIIGLQQKRIINIDFSKNKKNRELLDGIIKALFENGISWDLPERLLPEYLKGKHD